MFNLIKKYKFELIILVFFVITRVPDLGHDYFNTDAFKWKTRSYDFSTGIFTLQFDQTIQKYHPGVTLMWIGTLGIKIFNLYNDLILKIPENSIKAVFGLHFVQKFLVVLVIGTTLSFIFNALKKLFDTKYALIFVFLLNFEPFFLGLTRVFHLEGMQSTFMLASIVWFFYFINFKNIYHINNTKNNFNLKNEALKKHSAVDLFEKNKILFVSSLFSSLAVLTKTSALFLVPFFGLILLIDYFNHKNLAEVFKTYIVWLLSTILFIFLLWPALWVVPNNVLQTLYKGIFNVGIDTEHFQYYFGNLIDDPGMSFYVITFLLRSSYFLLFGFFSFLILYLLQRVKRLNINLSLTKIQKDFIIYNLLYIIFYFVMLTIPSKKLDRYALPFMISAVLLSSFFYYYLLSKLNKVITAFLFSLPVLYAVYWHPNYLAYYSVGLKNGINIIEPKWMIGQQETIEFFEQIKLQDNFVDSFDMSFEEVTNDPNLYSKTLSVGFDEKYYTQIYPFFRELGMWAVIKDLTPFAVKTNYFVYPVWADDSYNEDRFVIKFIGTIKIKGVDTYNVYQRIWP